MAQNRDYIPSAEAELLPWAKNLYAFALANFAKWGVPSPQATLETPISAYGTALAAYQDPNHGKIDTLNKNEAKAALVRALRTYIQGFLARNPGVSDEDREHLGLPLRDSVPTPRPAPDVKPETEAVPSGKGRHTVTAVNPQSESRRKPPLVAGVAFASRVRKADDPRARAEDMPSDFQTGTVRTYRWGEEDYGKVCDYATAYEGGGGKRGPWSDVTSLIIS